MKKLLHLKALQILRGDAVAIEEILKALRKTNGNMSGACALLGVGRSSMYRLIDELNAREQIDALIAEHSYRVRGKALDHEPEQGNELEEQEPALRARARNRARSA